MITSGQFPPGPNGVDMSREAVLRRLTMVGELNELCWVLGSSDLSRKAAKQAGRVWAEPWLTVAPECRDKQQNVEPQSIRGESGLSQ